MEHDTINQACNITTSTAIMAIYINYCENYRTIRSFAQSTGMTESAAESLIECGRALYEHTKLNG